MYEDKEIKDRILTKSEEMFTQFGYSKVKMEEVAEGLGISKKTLYKFFPSKEILVREMLESRRCDVESHIAVLWNEENLDFVDKLKKLMDYIGKETMKFNGPLLQDLQKNIPEIWDEIHKFRKEKSWKKVSDLIEEGIEKGIFRKDLNQQLAMLMYFNSVHSIINPETMAQLPFTANQAFETIIKIMFEGILTEEGRTKYLSNKNNGNNSK